MAWSIELIVKFANRTDLLAAANPANANNKPANGTLAIIETELGNQYTYNLSISKWRVHSGNMYVTSEMPTETDFEIPVYTKLTNTTTGAEFIQHP